MEEYVGQAGYEFVNERRVNEHMDGNESQEEWQRQ